MSLLKLKLLCCFTDFE